MCILAVESIYRKDHYLTGFSEDGNEAFYWTSIYKPIPENPLEATQENIDKFVSLYDQFTLRSVKLSDGVIDWNTVKVVYEGKGY